MPVNDVTTNRSYQKPNIANTLSDDVGRLRSALDAIDTDMASKAPTAGPTFTGVTTIAAGSAAAPSLTFTGATSDTGLYSPGTDQVAISTGGTGRLFVNASGNIGVGTASPASLLHVDNGVLNSGRYGAPGSIVLRSAAGTQASPTVISTSTNVAVVVGRGYDGTAYRDVAAIGVNSDGAISSTSSPGFISFNTTPSGSVATTERARIDSSGRLLVGLSTGSALVHIGSATDNLFMDRNETVVGGPNVSFRKSRGTSSSPLIVNADDFTGALQFRGYDGAAYITNAVIRGEVDGTPGLNDMPGRLIFSTTADGASSPTERLRITSDGKVGIGTGAPAVKLHVLETAATDTELRLGNSASYMAMLVDSGGVGKLVAPGGVMTFTASASERARIDSAGRLLVGTSTSIVEQYSGNARFQVATTVAYGIGAFNYTNDINECVLTLGKSRSITAGGHTVVQNGDSIGAVRFEGSDGTGFITATSIVSQVDGTPGTNDMPGRIILATTPDGTATPVEQWRINNAGTVIYRQPAPAAVDTSATLTVANMTAKIITSTTAAAVTMTLPTGTDMDAGFSGLYTNMAFEWYVINTGGTNAVTVAANTAHTVVGSGTVSANNSGKFLSRRTAATTWVTYRLSS